MTWVWQFLSLPFLIVFFRKKLFDSGWAWGRAVSWVSLGLGVWVLSLIGLPVNNRVGLWLLILFGSMFSMSFWQRHKQEISQFFRKKKKIICIEEAIFLLGFLALSLIRAFNPDILDLEKFMDVGLMQSYLRSPTLPVEDMWLAGEKVNYYTFGHFLGSQAIQLWGVNIAYAYNLLLGLLFGLILVESFSLISNMAAQMLGKKAHLKQILFPGFIGAFLVAIGANSHPLWYLLKNGSMEGYWYPDATRFIEFTIHEFPSYSFVVSDLHAHVWGVPFVLLFLMTAWWWVRLMLQKVSLSELTKWSIVMGVILGVLTMTSAWDVAIYALFLGVTGVVLLVKDTKHFIPLLVSGVVTVITLIVVSSTWWLNFESISQGTRLVQERSPLWQWLVLWSGHLMMSGIAAFLASKYLKKTSKLSSQAVMIIAMFITALILLILPEIVYVKDIYPNHPRANTMFKLTFQAFILMGLGIGWLTAFLQKVSPLPLHFKRGIKVMVVIFVLGVGFYPYYSYRSYYGEFKTYRGLDGLQWLESRYPTDYQAILWLKQHSHDGERVLEAVGESYTTYARVSTFTGLPTVLGWRVHEWLWRGGFDIPGARTEEVRQVYEATNALAAKQILDKYQVKYVFVGDLEREAYSRLNLPLLMSLGRVVYQSGSTLVISY